ncbi:MAG: xanthine dehydrogenase family protein subunit M [Pseudomonadota bacterium]
MRSRFNYIRPRSLKEALGVLDEHGRKAAVLAGGTDLGIAVRKETLAAECVVDVSRLSEMRSVGMENGLLRIGAAVTFTELIRDPLVLAYAPVAARGCRHIGSVQIRNAGTLGGNVANASPAADGVPSLVVHGARALVRSQNDERVVPVEELITGPYRTSLRPGELIVEFLLDAAPEGVRFSFHRVARRKALSIARINIAAMACVDADGTVTDIRMSVGSVTPSPTRMKAAETHLVGKRPTKVLVREAAEMVSAEMIRHSGVRPSTEYKKPAVEGLVTKALYELFGDV